MVYYSKLLIFILTFSFLGCQSESSTSSKKEAKKNESETSIFHLLFFQKEKKLELWTTKKDSEIQFLKSYESVDSEFTPIGIYNLNLEKEMTLQLESPNELYDEKIGQELFERIYILGKNEKKASRESIVINETDLEDLSKTLTPEIKIQVFVFPNDLRKEGQFEPCYGCPHRMAELYSSLELHLKNFN